MKLKMGISMQFARYVLIRIANDKLVIVRKITQQEGEGGQIAPCKNQNKRI